MSRLLEQEGARLTHILLTHGHYDHVGAGRNCSGKRCEGSAGSAGRVRR
ncbi:MAG: MBL fold metallo-hydrolase [Ruthenibacterium lactatiformans]